MSVGPVAQGYLPATAHLPPWVAGLCWGPAAQGCVSVLLLPAVCVLLLASFLLLDGG